MYMAKKAQKSSFVVWYSALRVPQKLWWKPFGFIGFPPFQKPKTPWPRWGTANFQQTQKQFGAPLPHCRDKLYDIKPTCRRL